MQTIQCSREHWPQDWQQGLIKTKNTMGVMIRELSPASEAFVEFSEAENSHMLDMGAAYGTATYPALENGASVVACDLSADHLAILKEGVPDSHQDMLTTIQGRFPDDFNFQPDTFNGINMSMMLHFLDDRETMAGLNKCHQWLKKGGKLFLTVASPYVGNLKALIPRFEERLQNNEQWPGVFHLDNKKDIAPDWADHLPPFIHVFTPETLKAIVEHAGFTVESSEYFTFNNMPDSMNHDGRECVALVARK